MKIHLSLTTLENKVRISKENKFIIYIKTSLVVYAFVYGVSVYISLLPVILYAANCAMQIAKGGAVVSISPVKHEG